MTRRLCVRCGLNPVGYIGRDSCWDCVPRRRNPVQICGRCGLNPVAYLGRECCYTCVPRRRRGPPVCKRCGSDDYYTRGLCRRCHRRAPLVDSCRDCLAWGVTRHHKWLCEACRGWRRRDHAETECPSCKRHVVVNERGYCRLCSRQATVINNRRPTHRTLDVAALNQHGQQLFFAELILKKRRLPPDTPDPPRQPMRWPARYPLAVELLALFPFTRRLDRGIVDRLGPPPIPGLADALHHPVGDHGARHGWSDDQCELTWRGIRLLLSMQDAPGTRIAWSEINLLLHLELTSVQSVIDVLTAVDMFHDDRPAPLAAWFDERVVGIAEPMRTELTAWFQVLRDGSTSPPRRKPRNIATVRSYVSTVLPALHTWGSNGHRSLREITRDDVINALAASDDERALLSGLRSLFSYLKARKLTFINPTAKLRTVRYQPAVPLAVDLAPIRAALHSDDPARACLTALLAFHAVRVDDLTHLQLIDVRDGRLYIGDHHLVLADPARARLNAWLDERTRRWPNSINAHLFIHSRSAGRTRAVTPDWIALTVGIPPSRIRQDRILHEAFASGGDARRLCDLFGISVPTAERYVAATRPDEHTLTNTAGTVSS